MPSVNDSILITGGGGMLAAAFRRILPSAHYATRTEADITDENGVGSLFLQLRPTLLINCAAYTKVDLAEQEEAAASAVNGAAVGMLARLCRDYGTKLVHYSTDYVFDGTLRRPLRPDDPVGPQSAYGRSKLLGEQAIQQVQGLEYLIIRTAWLYGPNGPCFPATMINLARQGKPLKVINDQVGSPTFTHDLAEATLNLIDARARGIFHVTNSGETNWYDFTAAILEEFDLKTDLSPTTSAQWKQLKPSSATRPAYSVLDISDYTRVTGKPLRHWREALHDYRLALQE